MYYVIYGEHTVPNFKTLNLLLVFEQNACARKK